MADEPDKDEKTEEATEQKIQDALKKGQTPTSKEVPTLFSLVTAAIMLAYFLPALLGQVTQGMVGIMHQSAQIKLTNVSDLNALLWIVAMIVLTFVGPFFVAFIISAIVGGVVQNPPRIVWDRVAPKLSNISLAKGWSRIFSVKGLVEFGKSVAKIFFACLVVWFVSSTILDDLVSSMQVEILAFLSTVQFHVVKIVFAIAGAMVLVTAFDVAWTRFDWRKGLKMTRREIKDELKQNMGDPMLKSRQRSVALERSRSRMMQAVPNATVIIANPTHFSVALRYDRETDAAPMVVAMGADVLALRIREIAKEHDVPIVENVELARGLYKIAKLDQAIPPEFFAPVAQVLAFLKSRSELNRSYL